MSRVGVDQDHQIICKPCILDVGVLAETRGLFRPLQHTVNLGEVEIAEQWRDHPALRNATLTVGFEHDLQQAHHVCIIHPSCHLGQQTIMSNVVKIAAQVDVYDACLLLNNRSGYPVDRFMSCPLGTISKRSRLEVCLENRLQHELERTLHHSISDRRNRKDADLAPVLWYLLPPGQERHIGVLNEFVPYPFEKTLYALRFDGREGHPVTSRSPIVVLRVPHRSDFGAPCCLRPTVAGSALGFTHFRGHIRVHCCYGPVARDLPEEDLVDRLQSFGFPPPCYPNYGAPDSCPGRFISC